MAARGGVGQKIPWDGGFGQMEQKLGWHLHVNFFCLQCR